MGHAPHVTSHGPLLRLELIGARERGISPPILCAPPARRGRAPRLGVPAAADPIPVPDRGPAAPRVPVAPALLIPGQVRSVALNRIRATRSDLRPGAAGLRRVRVAGAVQARRVLCASRRRVRVRLPQRLFQRPSRANARLRLAAASVKRLMGSRQWRRRRAPAARPKRAPPRLARPLTRR